LPSTAGRATLSDETLKNKQYFYKFSMFRKTSLPGFGVTEYTWLFSTLHTGCQFPEKGYNYFKVINQQNK